MKQPCPTCGKPQKRRAKVCDYCGTDLTGRLANPATPGSGGISSSPPIPQPGPFSSPTGMVPVLGRTTKTIIGFVIAAAVIAGAVVGFFVVTKQVRKGIDAVRNVVTVAPPEQSSGVGDSGGKPGGKPGTGSGDSSRDFKGARDMFKAMADGGAKCGNYDLVVETTVVSAATCFAGTEVWTIQVFLDDLSYDAVVNSYKENESIHVAYGGNWTVLTQTKASSKKIAKALDGKAT
jgi:hypothetical protein